MPAPHPTQQLCTDGADCREGQGLDRRVGLCLRSRQILFALPPATSEPPTWQLFSARVLARCVLLQDPACPPGEGLELPAPWLSCHHFCDSRKALPWAMEILNHTQFLNVDQMSLQQASSPGFLYCLRCAFPWASSRTVFSL